MKNTEIPDLPLPTGMKIENTRTVYHVSGCPMDSVFPTDISKKFADDIATVSHVNHGKGRDINFNLAITNGHEQAVLEFLMKKAAEPLNEAD